MKTISAGNRFRNVNKTAIFDVDKIAILYTPRTPVFIKILVFLAITNLARAQPAMPPEPMEDDTIKAQIYSYYRHLTRIEMEEYQELNKYKWMNYMPNLGYSAFNGFTVGYDLTNIAQYFNDQQARESKRHQIKEANLLEAKRTYNDYLEVKIHYQNLLKEISKREKIIELESRIYNIWEKKYKNNEITPSEFLQKKISFENKMLSLDKLKMESKRLKATLSYYQNLNPDVH